MQRRRALLSLTLALAAAACGGPPAEMPQPSVAQTPADAAGWTGITEPEEIIEARRVLMIAAQRLMEPVDRFVAGEPEDARVLRDNATTIEALLLALPHLFPPTTNLYDAAVLEPPTVTLPAVWQSFDAFLAQAGAAETAVAELIAAGDEDALRGAGARLRAACDACHAAFMKPYTPPKTTPEDFEFDFESVLPPE